MANALTLLADVPASKLKLAQFGGFYNPICLCADNSVTFAETTQGAFDEVTLRFDRCEVDGWDAGDSMQVFYDGEECHCEYEP